MKSPTQNVVTIIPARGGSKSIPKKNIRLLGGRPLLQYSVAYSLQCPLVSKTIVSTDSEEIAGIAKECGASVPFLRPAEFALDETPDYPVMRHALETLETIYKEPIDLLILLRPTSPLRPAGLIEKGLSLLEQNPNATSLRSIALCEQHPYRMWKKEGPYIKGYESNISESYNLPRQKLPPVYFQTGDIEIIRRSTLLNQSVSGDRVISLVIEADQMLDIDNEEDIQRAASRLS